MLNISFFAAASSSIIWLIYSFNYINFLELVKTGSTEQLYQGIMIVFFPIAVIWGLFLTAQSRHSEKKTNTYILHILDRLDKNAENLNTLNCSLIAAEKEIKSAFVLNEFNLLISDINEILADIIKRSNSVSSTQMEHLWARTSGGERWLMAKTFIETCSFQTGFTNHLLNKAQKDSLLKGSILEFHSRFKSLHQLLDAYDTQKTFFNMIEYGAMGKVYNLITPIAENLASGKSAPTRPPRLQEKLNFTLTEEPTLTFPSFLSEEKEEKIPQFEAPQITRPLAGEEIDNSLKAIRNELFTPSESIKSSETLADEMPAPVISNFTQTQTALQNIRKTEKKRQAPTPAPTVNKSKIISLAELEEEINASPDNNYDEYAYPFGGWTNEKNSK